MLNMYVITEPWFLEAKVGQIREVEAELAEAMARMNQG